MKYVLMSVPESGLLLPTLCLKLPTDTFAALKANLQNQLDSPAVVEAAEQHLKIYPISMV
ncbi:Uncharacterised protein [Serratia entomophila]|uniref:hypothetical protein n=1 Tax=Serratia entomophila TaxID=42906 RepID=UPI001F246B39|nr:hypothetical protein [Serratia entomophila]UIW18815.1 hypothetical protein KHA73_02305 [Serratia entomophila]CAI0817654.1 Uncharacterised protein [Serratia entomophila]CAI0838364.1 Uncharacterised protein [Serratia entomophila]CAI0855928.1 Uncharacterised protein [Serratia entomophila]CAI0889454.1 Uncharacterised protein [Serratia entomophila]